MASKIFITGSTGYIGGTVLDTLVKQHPEYEVTVLLRNVPDGFQKRYPNAQIVKGDYDSSDVISDAASKANVVVHNGNSDHEPSINALIAGLLKRSGSSFLIHLSGTGIVADWRDGTHLGKLNPKVWSDIDDIDEITSRPDPELHRNVDKIIQTAAAQHGDKLKTAIMCPPDVYGPGRGPGRTQSVYFPVFCNEIESLGAPFYTGEGTNTRSWVHIEDLMTVYLKLTEAAVAGGKGADWGKEGYYFTASQEASQVDIAKAVGKILKSHGRVQTAEAKVVSLDTVAGMLRDRGVKNLGYCKYFEGEHFTFANSAAIMHVSSPLQAVKYALGAAGCSEFAFRDMFAANSRTRAHRAAKLFGYEPKAANLWETLEADLLAYA